MQNSILLEYLLSSNKQNKRLNIELNSNEFPTIFNTALISEKHCIL